MILEVGKYYEKTKNAAKGGLEITQSVLGMDKSLSRVQNRLDLLSISYDKWSRASYNAATSTLKSSSSIDASSKSWQDYIRARSKNTVTGRLSGLDTNENILNKYLSYAKEVTSANSKLSSSSEITAKSFGSSLHQAMMLVAKDFQSTLTQQPKVESLWKKISTTISDYARKVQTAVFHDLDLRDSINKIGRSADENNPKIKSFGDLLSKLSEFKGAIIGSVIGSAGVHEASAMELSIVRLLTKTGQLGTSVSKLTDDYEKFALQNRLSAQDLANIAVELANQGMQFNQISPQITKYVKQFMDVNNVSMESAAAIASYGTRFLGYGQDINKYFNVLTKAAEGTQVSADTLGQSLQSMAGYFREAAQAAGLPVDVMARKLVPSILAVDRVLTRSFGDPESAKDLFKGLSDVTSDQGKALQSLFSATGKNYNQMVQLFKQGHPEIAFEQLQDSIRKVSQQGTIGVAVLNNLASALHVSPDLLRSLGDTKESIRATAEQLQKAATNSADLDKKWNLLRNTFAGLFTQFEDIGKTILVKIGQPLANEVKPVLSTINNILTKIPDNVLTITGQIGALVVTIGVLKGGFKLLASIVSYVFGSTISSSIKLMTSSVRILTTSVTGLNTVLGSSITSVGALGTAIGVVSAGFIGWKLGSWMYDNIKLIRKMGDATADLILNIPGVKKLVETLNGVNPAINQAQFAESVEMLKKKLAARNIIIPQGNLSLEAYAKKLRDAAIAASPSKNSKPYVEWPSIPVPERVVPQSYDIATPHHSITPIANNVVSNPPLFNAATRPTMVSYKSPQFNVPAPTVVTQNDPELKDLMRSLKTSIERIRQYYDRQQVMNGQTKLSPYVAGWVV